MPVMRMLSLKLLKEAKEAITLVTSDYRFRKVALSFRRLPGLK